MWHGYHSVSEDVTIAQPRVSGDLAHKAHLCVTKLYAMPIDNRMIQEELFNILFPAICSKWEKNPIVDYEFLKIHGETLEICLENAHRMQKVYVLTTSRIF